MNIYKIDDLIIDYSKSIGSGSYGEIIPSKIKSTNVEVILKKYKKFSGDSLIPKDFFKEILFLNRLKHLKSVVKLYGIIRTNEELYLIIEKLDNDFYNIIESFLHNNINPEPNEYKQTFYDILVAFKEIHEYGILHNDIKVENLMYSKDGIKIIDMGLANFFGTRPYYNFRKAFTGTTNTMSPDVFISKSIINNNKDLIIYSKQQNISNYKKYSSDTYSIATIFIHYIVYRLSRPFITNNTILMDTNNINSKILTLPDGNNLYDLLLHMLNTNSQIRYTEYNALSHPYFLSYDNTKRQNIYYGKYLKGSLKETLKEELKGGSIEETYKDYSYSDKIHNNYINDTISFDNISKDNLKYIKYYECTNLLLKEYLTNIESEGSNNVIHGDSLLNAIIFIRKNTHILNIEDINTYRAVIYIYDSIFITNPIIKLNPSIINPILYNIIDNIIDFSFYPFISQIDYIKYNIDVYINIYNYIININSIYNQNIWDLILYFSNMECKSKDIIYKRLNIHIQDSEHIKDNSGDYSIRSSPKLEFLKIKDSFDLNTDIMIPSSIGSSASINLNK